MLPVHPHPRDDEILSCWMVRLAVANRFKLHSFYVKLLGYAGEIWNRDVDRHPAPDLIGLLSEHTAHSPLRLRDMSLLAYEGTLTPSVGMAPHVSSWIIPLGIFHRLRRRDGMQFCPLCLASDGNMPYFRRQWRLALHCVCERHRCLLCGHCPHCGKPVAYFRHDFNQLAASSPEALALCWNCHFDLRASKPELLACDENAWPWLFDAMDVLCPVKGYAWTHSAMSLAYYQGIMILVRVLSSRHGARLLDHTLRAIAFPDSVTLGEHRLGLSGMPARQRIALLLAVGYLLGEWPDRFVSCCKQCHIQRSNFSEMFAITPWWIYQQVTSHFDERIYMFSQQEIDAAIHYLQKLELRVTARNLRKFIGMTANAAASARHDYLLRKFLEK